MNDRLAVGVEMELVSARTFFFPCLFPPSPAALRLRGLVSGMSGNCRWGVRIIAVRRRVAVVELSPEMDVDGLSSQVRRD